MKSNGKDLSKDKPNGDIGGITKTIFVIFVASFFIVSFTPSIIQANAAPLVVDGDTYGSWEDTFKDTSGVETWDNLELTEEGIRLIDYLYENFSALSGDLPDTKKWNILDDGYVLEISGNVLRTEVNPPASTWKREMIQTKDDFGGNHTLTWRQNLYTVSSGMYYHFFILNGSDGSSIFGVNQLYTDQYQIYNMVASTGLQIGTSVSGWHDFKVTFNNGFIQFFFDGVMKYEYDFKVPSVIYQFGTNALDTWNRVHTDDICIYSNITKGNITSAEIILPAGKTWESFIINKSEYGIDNNINVSILDGVTYLPIPGFENFSDTNVDISTIDEGTHPTIRLRAYFTVNGSATPTPFLRGWKITWLDTIPPLTPTGLTVTDQFTGNSLFLNWNANVESDVTNYILYYSTDDITFYKLTDVPADTLSFTHFGLTTGTTYYYKITAADEVPNQSPDSVVITGVPDIDTDSDGTGNIDDEDDDGDTVPDVDDEFPLNPNEWFDSDSDGIGDNADYDDDGDGYDDTIDEFPLNDSEWNDLDDDGIGDNSDDDIDGDGVLNIDDEFPMDPTEWEDTDLDGIGNNKDLDIDGDDVYNFNDAFPFDHTEWNDLDNDGVGDNSDSDKDGDSVENILDKFPENFFEWSDADSDGIGDNADSDDDNDGYLDVNDGFPNNSTEWSDLDLDGIGDNSDLDRDGDGVGNNADLFPTIAYEWDDFDLDGIGDNSDLDDDNDGHPDTNDDYPYDSSKWQKPNELIPFLYILIILGIIILAVMFFELAKIGKLQKTFDAANKIESSFQPQRQEIPPDIPKEYEIEKIDDDIEKPPNKISKEDFELTPPPPPPK
jgi:hypothetical protein